MMDKYDEAIEYLTQNPSHIVAAWAGRSPEARCLFATVDGQGCLTQIRNNPKLFDGGEWHDEIVADKRIPKLSTAITVNDLPVFAEWQRRING